MRTDGKPELHAEPARLQPRFVFLTGEPAGRRPGSIRPIRAAWRILAANNRAMGFSAEHFADLEDCYAAALDFHLNAAAADVTIAALPGIARWTWRVQLAGVTAATAAHDYQRRIECVRGVNTFLAAALAATPRVDDVSYIGASALFGREPDVNAEDAPRHTGPIGLIQSF